MKKIILLGLFTIFLAGCSGDDIKTVQNGLMDFNKTVTVGQALNNWSSCHTKEWKESKAINGTRVVEFKCTHDMTNWVDKAIDTWGEKAGSEDLDIEASWLVLQFTLNVDNSFQVEKITKTIRWKDGKVMISDDSDVVKKLKHIYNNEPEWDLGMIDSNSMFSTLGALRMGFGLIRSGLVK